MPYDEAVQRLLDGFVASLPSVVPLRALWLHGSLALGDYQVGVSDLDLIAVLDRPVGDAAALQALHRSLEVAHPLARGLHCSYLQVSQLGDSSLRHPTWAHSEYFSRPVTAVTRRELLLGDLSIYGPAPSSLLPATTDEELAAFIWQDLETFWYPAARRWKRWWADVWVDLGLITVARAGVTLADGRLITKREALELLPSLGAPTAVVADIYHRRYGPAALPAKAQRDGVLRRNPISRVRRGFAARRFVRSTIDGLLGPG
ncbi:nucleotidyltransferase domain-containing protein [Kribbella koreensis]|uniref:Nucleotidyltransferase domain-containing protein n=1 Tax=Kribbella koreensis TaxID=57909 RepID=A0ABN1Q5V7_9ACTN